MTTQRRHNDTFLSRNFGMIEPMCDADGLYDGCLVPKEQGRFLVWLSWFAMLSGLIGIWYGWHWLGFGVCMGSLLAQLYWSNPTYSWRRTLDMSWVQLLMWLHMVAAWRSPVFLQYIMIQLFGVGLYTLSWWCMKHGSSWAGTLFHGGVHACANLSVLLLYLSA